MERKCSPSPLNAHVHSRHYAKAWLYKTPQIDQQIAWEKTKPKPTNCGTSPSLPLVKPKPVHGLFEDRDVVLGGWKQS